MASKSEWVEPQRKKQTFFFKPASPIEPSRGINQTSNAGKPETSATGTNQFSCSERRLFHLRASEVKETSDNTGGKNCRPHVPGRNIFPPRLSTSHDIPAQTRQGGRRRNTQRCGYPQQHRQSVVRRSTGETDWESTSSYDDRVSSCGRRSTTAVVGDRRKPLG